MLPGRRDSKNDPGASEVLQDHNDSIQCQSHGALHISVCCLVLSAVPQEQLKHNSGEVNEMVDGVESRRA